MRPHGDLCKDAIPQLDPYLVYCPHLRNCVYSCAHVFSRSTDRSHALQFALVHICNGFSSRLRDTDWLEMRYNSSHNALQMRCKSSHNAFNSLKGHWTTSASFPNCFQKSWDFFTITCRSVYLCSDCMLNLTCNFSLITKICEFFLQRPFLKVYF